MIIDHSCFPKIVSFFTQNLSRASQDARDRFMCIQMCLSCTEIMFRDVGEVTMEYYFAWEGLQIDQTHPLVVRLVRVDARPMTEKKNSLQHVLYYIILFLTGIIFPVFIFCTNSGPV